MAASIDVCPQVLMCGDGGVGKSSLALGFVLGTSAIVQDYDPTILNQYSKSNIMVDGSTIARIDIFDIQGQEEYTSIRIDTIRECDAFILVYSLTQPSTFDVLQQWILEVKQAKSKINDYKGIPWVVCAMKYDLLNQRRITKEKGQKLAKLLKAPYFEACATNSQLINVDKVFESIIREWRKYERYSVLKPANKLKKKIAHNKVSSFMNKMFKNKDNNDDDKDNDNDDIDTDDDDINEKEAFREIFGTWNGSDDDAVDAVDQIKKLVQQNNNINDQQDQKDVDPQILLDQLMDNNNNSDIKLNIMNKIHSNLGNNDKYNKLLEIDIIPELLLSYSMQIDNKVDKSVQTNAIITIPDIFKICINHNEQRAVISVQNIFDNLFKFYDINYKNIVDSLSELYIQTSIQKIVNLLITSSKKNTKTVTFLAGILNELVRIENIKSGYVRRFSMMQLIKIMFPKTCIKLVNDIFDNNNIIKTINLNELPAINTSHRNWLDVACNIKSGLIINNDHDEFRDIISNAISQLISDNDNSQIGLNIANIMYQLNANWIQLLGIGAKSKWDKQNLQKPLAFDKRSIPPPPPRIKPYIQPAVVDIIGENDYDDEGDVKNDNQNVNDNDDDDLSLRQKAFRAYFFKISIYKAQTQIYYDAFVSNDCDDLEHLSTFIEDPDILKDDIGMKTIHRKHFIKKANEFNKNNEKFRKLFDILNMDEYYQNIMVEQGIMTFDQFYGSFNVLDDLIKVIGDNNKNDAKIIWDNMPKNIRKKDIQKKQQNYNDIDINDDIQEGNSNETAML